MKRNVIIATVAALGLASPAAALAANSASHHSDGVSKAERHDVSRHDRSRDRVSVERASRDMRRTHDSVSPVRDATSGSSAHDPSSPDRSPGNDAGFDR